ncbi:MAG TPA: ATP-grasp domain-containing protein [Candidatus Saccharimonadales bacterium]|jgi:biotin carboxylase
MLWIVGHAFADIRTYLHDREISFGVLINKNAPQHRALAETRVAPVDFSSPESLLASADALDIDVSGILVAGYENYVLPAAILSEHFHVPGLSQEVAAATTDKAIMRQKFIEYNPAIGPDYKKVTDWNDIDSFMSSHHFPVMLKPTNLMKSLFITKNNSLDELQRNYNEMVRQLAGLHDKLYTMTPPEIIIEECLIGSMHTVAGYADADGNPHLFEQVVDCVTGQDVGFHENYIYSRQLPSILSQQQISEILEVSRQGMLALGLTSTMVHIELMLTSDGPKLIEIGARIGGYRTRMYEYSSHIDLNKIMIDLALGEQPNPTLGSRTDPIAVIELFPEAEGMFDHIINEQSLNQLPSLRHFSIKAESGKAVGRTSHGYKATAVVIIGNSDRSTFEADFAYIKQHVRVAIR